MRVGLIAYEFLPAFGGMQQLAEAIASQLGLRHDVAVFGRPTSTRSDGRYTHHAVLTGDLAFDALLLQSHQVDVWMTTNAGAAPLAEYLSAPLLVYVNGNDLLIPWIGRYRAWFNTVARLPAGWRILPWLRQEVWRRDIRRTLDRVATVAANSRYTITRLREFHAASGDRCVLIPPGVAEHFFQPSAPRTEPRTGLRLLSVTRLTTAARRKNIDGVLHAIAALPPDTQVSYVIVGDGDDRGRLEQLARDLGIAGKTVFAGKVASEDLLRFYAEADLFVLAAEASSRDVEGFGIVYLEASAAGVPSLLSRTGGATDAVEDGVNGILVPDGSSWAIRAGLERFLAERALFPPEKVRAFAEPFRWRAIVTQLEERLQAIAKTQTTG
jgi:glycosyltransferase involved in cell wall biosynthesis